MRVRLRRPSPALVVSIVALVVALGGTALAGPVAHVARKLSGSSIRLHSIRGNRLKANTLTGAQIRESSLGTVPSALAAAAAQSANTANTAKSADRAHDADALGGVGPGGYLPASRIARFALTMTKGDPERTVGQAGPMTFTATCTADADKTFLKVFAHSTADGTFYDTLILNNGQQSQSLGLDNAAAGANLSFDVTIVAAGGSPSYSGRMTGIVNHAGKDCEVVGYAVQAAG